VYRWLAEALKDMIEENTIGFGESDWTYEGLRGRDGFNGMEGSGIGSMETRSLQKSLEASGRYNVHSCRIAFVSLKLWLSCLLCHCCPRWFHILLLKVSTLHHSAFFQHAQHHASSSLLHLSLAQIAMALHGISTRLHYIYT
jgi:hypothetical protein